MLMPKSETTYKITVCTCIYNCFDSWLRTYRKQNGVLLLMLVPSSNRGALVNSTVRGGSSRRGAARLTCRSSQQVPQQQLHTGTTPEWQEEQKKRTTLYKPSAGASNNAMQNQPGTSHLPHAPSLDYRRTSNITVDNMPHGLRKSCVLFFTEDFRGLAERIAAHSQGHIELGSIRWRCVCVFAGGMRQCMRGKPGCGTH